MPKHKGDTLIVPIFSFTCQCTREFTQPLKAVSLPCGFSSFTPILLLLCWNARLCKIWSFLYQNNASSFHHPQCQFFCFRCRFYGQVWLHRSLNITESNPSHFLYFRNVHIIFENICMQMRNEVTGYIDPVSC